MEENGKKMEKTTKRKLKENGRKSKIIKIKFSN